MEVLPFKSPVNSLQIRLKRYGVDFDKLCQHPYVTVYCTPTQLENTMLKFAKLGLCTKYEVDAFTGWCIVRVSVN